MEHRGRKVLESPLELVIADDHPLMRQALRQTLESAGLHVAGEAGDGKAAVKKIVETNPAIAILDIAMPLLDGFGVVREVRRLRLPVEIVFLTANHEEALFEEAIAQSVKGYVLKESSASDIVTAVHSVAAGQRYASPALTTYLVYRSRRTPGSSSSLALLTATELRVLRLISDYQTTREIAEAMSVSPLTVETHRRNICEKLSLRGSHALVKFALANRKLMA